MSQSEKSEPGRMTAELEQSMRRGWKLLREHSGWGDNVGLLFVELAALRAALTASWAEVERLETELDPPVCRLQFPDGSVPSNAREAAEGWKRVADALRAQVKELKAGLERPLYERICECGDFESQHQGGGPCSVCCQKRAPYDGCEVFRPSGFEKLTDYQKGITPPTPEPPK